MIIDFTAIQEEMRENMRGGEKHAAIRAFTDGLGNRIMRGRLIPGASIGRHTHEDGSEFIFILQGKGRALYNDGQEDVSAGVCHFCPKGQSHSLINDGDEDLVFFAVVAIQ